MTGRSVIIISGLVCLALLASTAQAGFVYVATAKNFRGALYVGVGPTPAHASEMAIVKCSQDSVIPMTCRICAMRKELAMGPPPLKKMHPSRKYRKSKVRYSREPYRTGRPYP